MRQYAILLILTVASIAAPVAGFLAVSAYAGYRQASVRHADLERQERELREYSQEVVEYRQFAERVERFITAARRAGVAAERWNRHRVEIEDRVATFAELNQFIADAGSGANYYFLPARMRIEARGPAETRNPFLSHRPKLEPDQVRMSLVGDFLVPVP